MDSHCYDWRVTIGLVTCESLTEWGGGADVS